MVETRWLRSIGPGVIALGIVGILASTTLGVGDRPFAPVACPGPASELAASVRDGGPAADDLRGRPWFRVDPLLDRDGALRAQRLVAGLAGDRSQDPAELPPESFVAGPYGDVVLVGTDDGATSQLVAVDVSLACAWGLADETDVIRRATIDPAGTTVYESRVDRATRLDLGVWARPIGYDGPARRILEPLPDDVRYGRTFSTAFAWDVDGRRLAVQSCGEVACRTRVVGPMDGTSVTMDDPGLGNMVGLAEGRLVTYAACRGLPCPLVAMTVATGERLILESDAGPAAVVDTPDGTWLVHEAWTGGARFLRAVALDDRRVTPLGPIPDGLGLLSAVTRSDDAIGLPPGWVLLGPDGRVPVGRTSVVSQLRHIPDGTTATLDEAIR